MEAILIKNDFWENGKILKPTPVTEATTRAVTNEKEIDTWETPDNKARSDIILSISPSELRHVKRCKTSCEIWVKLAEIYQSKGPASNGTLLKWLVLTKMQESEHMRDHLNLFFDTNGIRKQKKIVISRDVRFLETEHA